MSVFHPFQKRDENNGRPCEYGIPYPLKGLLLEEKMRRAGCVSNEYGIYRWRPCPVYKGWSDYRQRNGSYRGRWSDGIQSSTPTQMERLLSILLFCLEFYCVPLVHPLLGTSQPFEEVA